MRKLKIWIRVLFIRVPIEIKHWLQQMYAMEHLNQKLKIKL
jgi:hypothetical protein